ncbi:MAG: hypothetical protein K5848_03120 [Lachnospiraceae bacterium]|nr:hypothetical protein [Lachnospiraceae bacterium]
MKKFIKKHILKNFWLKLISLVVAVICWCAVMNRSDPYTSVTLRNISVNKINEDVVTGDNMLYEVKSGDTIDITFYGPRSEIQTLSASGVEAYVDLKELSITESCPIHVVFVNEEKYKNVRVVDKSFETMQLSLESMVTESKQVICDITGTPPSGFYPVATVLPATVDVYGSSNAVDSIASLKARVDVSDATSSFEKEVSFVAVDSNGEEFSPDVTYESTKVTLSVTMYPTKTVNVNLDYDVSPAVGFAIGDLKYAPMSVSIAGSYALISTITDINIAYENKEIIEDVNDSISLADYLPEGVYLASNTNVVSVTIPAFALDDNKTLSASINSMETTSLSEKFKINNATNAVTLNVWGALGSLDSISASDLNLSLDLSDITAPGTYDLPVTCNNNKYMVDDAVITVEIVEAETENETE